MTFILYINMSFLNKFRLRLSLKANSRFVYFVLMWMNPWSHMTRMEGKVQLNISWIQQLFLFHVTKFDIFSTASV